MPNALVPELIEIAAEAFSRAWTFIQHDPLLFGHEPALLQTELARQILAHIGEHEPNSVRLANRAIASLRERMVGYRVGVVRQANQGRPSRAVAGGSAIS